MPLGKLSKTQITKGFEVRHYAIIYSDMSDTHNTFDVSIKSVASFTVREVVLITVLKSSGINK